MEAFLQLPFLTTFSFNGDSQRLNQGPRTM
jgi:hypothetical protein